jgi:hypothetical protein
MEIRVARALLPEVEAERNEFLKRYFCELAASATWVDDGWSIHLERPHHEDFYIDPCLRHGLEWWSNHFGRIDIASIPFAIYRIRGLQLSLNDSWTLYAWSRWLQERVEPKSSFACITVLHLDDHDDLMTPRVTLDGEEFSDLISGSVIDLWQPGTVAAAVKSGAIGIGSFMAPLLHEFPNVHVRHLCSSEYSKNRQGAHVVRPIFVPDNLLSPGSCRIGLQVHQVKDAVKMRLDGDHPYIVTDNLSQWLKDIPDGPVLVHIDMDYFNNAFNGDSDWVDYGPKYDPPLADVLARIDSVFESLESERIAERVADVAVSLSPGFFRADMWAPSIERIQQQINRLTKANRWMSVE